MIDPVHFIRFANGRQAHYAERIALANERIAAKIAKHEASIWHRWFRVKYESSMWDDDIWLIGSAKGWIKDLDKLKRRAEYHRKMQTQMDCPDKEFLTLFYDWCAENDIPF